MPGGVGPVSEDIVLACGRLEREIAQIQNTNEVFYHLNSRQVFFDTDQGYLYFADSPQGSIRRTIRAALTSLNGHVAIEQLHLDQNKVFAAACRVRLTPEHADTVLVALRLTGIRARFTRVQHAPALPDGQSQDSSLHSVDTCDPHGPTIHPD